MWITILSSNCSRSTRKPVGRYGRWPTMTRITASIDTRGAAHGLREYGRGYAGFTARDAGVHPMVVSRTPAPSPLMMPRRLRCSISLMSGSPFSMTSSAASCRMSFGTRRLGSTCHDQLRSLKDASPGAGLYDPYTQIGPNIQDCSVKSEYKYFSKSNGWPER